MSGQARGRDCWALILASALLAGCLSTRPGESERPTPPRWPTVPLPQGLHMVEAFGSSQEEARDRILVEAERAVLREEGVVFSEDETFSVVEGPDRSSKEYERNSALIGARGIKFQLKQIEISKDPLTGFLGFFRRWKASALILNGTFYEKADEKERAKIQISLSQAGH